MSEMHKCLLCLENISYTIDSSHCNCKKIPIHRECFNQLMNNNSEGNNILCPYCNIKRQYIVSFRIIIPPIRNVNNSFDEMINKYIAFINYIISLPIEMYTRYPYIPLFILMILWFIILSCFLLFTYFIPVILYHMDNFYYELCGIFLGIYLIL